MIRKTFAIGICLLIAAGLPLPVLAAGTCMGNPTIPPEQWGCGMVVTQKCGSYDADAKPTAIDAAIVGENGKPIRTGEWVYVTVPIVGQPDGQHETVYWRTCKVAGLDSYQILQMPFAGIPLGTETSVEDKSTATQLLVAASWPSTPPAWMTSLVYKARVTAPAGTIIRLSHQSVRQRINYQGVLVKSSQFTVQ